MKSLVTRSLKLNLSTAPLVAIAHDHLRHTMVGHCKRYMAPLNWQQFTKRIKISYALLITQCLSLLQQELE